MKEKDRWVTVSDREGNPRGGGPMVGVLGYVLWAVCKEFGITSFIVDIEGPNCDERPINQEPHAG